MIKFTEKIAEMAAKGVIGGRWGLKLNPGHPGGLKSKAVGWVSGSRAKIFLAGNRPKPAIWPDLCNFSRFFSEYP